MRLWLSGTLVDIAHFPNFPHNCRPLARQPCDQPFDVSACYVPLLGRTLFFGMEANMDAAFSFLISIVIIAFGVWIVAATVATGLALLGLLTVLVGSISLYQATRDFKIA
jgi:hypothetical protein